MTLSAWLVKEKISSAEYSRRSGLSYFAIRKWLDGTRIPTLESALQIQRSTNGEVPVEIWLPDFAPSAPVRRRAAR